MSSPSASQGWSINAVLNLNSTRAVFGRANPAYDTLTPIRSSFANGGAMNKPLERSATDETSLGIGYGTASAAPLNPVRGTG